MDPFVGEIRAAAYTFAPTGWAYCYGQQMQIQQNQALYALLGIQFGGNGKTTFNLPDLRGRCIIGNSTITPQTGEAKRIIGETGGSENAQFVANNIPPHNHTANIGGTAAVSFKMSGDQGDIDDPTGAMFAKIKTGTTFQKSYNKSSSTVIAMASNSVTLDISKITTAISPTGSTKGPSIMQPFLVINYMISTTGLWPPRS